MVLDTMNVNPREAAAFAAVTIASLTYSVYSTQLQAGAAYFSTLTRGWELALGGLLALVPASRLGRQPRWVAFALGWAGLGAIAFATYRFNDGTLFPGYAALVPTLGTAAIIAAGIGATTASCGTVPAAYTGVRSGTSGGSPTHGTCGTGLRSSSPPPSGENSRPSKARPS